MECQLVVQDYKKIQKSKVTVKGFTVLSAPNGSGKTTLFDSLIKVLDNDFSDDYCRHGTSSYLVGIKFDHNNVEHQLVIKRQDGVSSLSINGSPFRSKLGRSAMHQVIPEFPLKRVDYESTKIYPNFALQGDIPMFEDITPTDLLSSLYSSVFKIAKQAAASKKKIAEVKEMLLEKRSQFDFVNERIHLYSSSLPPKERQEELKASYDKLCILRELESKISSLREEINSIPDYEGQQYEPLVVKCNALVPSYNAYNQSKPLVERLSKLKENLVEVSKNLQKYNFKNDSVEFLQLVMKLRKLQNSDSVVKLQPYEVFSEEDFHFYELGSRYFSLKHRGENLKKSLDSILKEESEVRKSLGDSVCPIIMNLGSCPYGGNNG